MRLGYRKKCQTEVQKKKKKKSTSITLSIVNSVSLPRVCSSPCDPEASHPAGRAAAQPDSVLVREAVEAAGGEMPNKTQFSSFTRGCSLACPAPLHVVLQEGTLLSVLRVTLYSVVQKDEVGTGTITAWPYGLY